MTEAGPLLFARLEAIRQALDEYMQLINAPGSFTAVMQGEAFDALNFCADELADIVPAGADTDDLYDGYSGGGGDLFDEIVELFELLNPRGPHGGAMIAGLTAIADARLQPSWSGGELASFVDAFIQDLCARNGDWLRVHVIFLYLRLLDVLGYEAERNGDTILEALQTIGWEYANLEDVSDDDA